MGLIILKQILNKWISILVIFCLCFSFVSPAFAETQFISNGNYTATQIAEIVSVETIPLEELTLSNSTLEVTENGGYYSTLSEISFDEEAATILSSNNTLSSKSTTGYVTFGFSSCTDKTVTVSVLNIATESVTLQDLKLTVSGNAYNGPYATRYIIGTKICPVGLTKFTVSTRQITCKEGLELDGKVALSEGMFEVVEPGKNHRVLNDTVLNDWNRGSFSTLEESLNYHFYEHGNDPYIQPIETILDYCKSARNFLNTCKSQNVAGSVPENGTTPGVYKYRIGKVYITAAGTKTLISGPIYSYGGK